MAQKYVDSFGTRKTLTVGSQSYDIFRLDLLEKSGLQERLQVAGLFEGPFGEPAPPGRQSSCQQRRH